MSTTYALESYRRLIAEGYRYETSIGRGGHLTLNRRSYWVPPADCREVRRMSDEADAEVRPHDTECRECGATFPAPPIGRCPKCGGRYLRRI